MFVLNAIALISLKCRESACVSICEWVSVCVNTWGGDRVPVVVPASYWHKSAYVCGMIFSWKWWSCETTNHTLVHVIVRDSIYTVIYRRKASYTAACTSARTGNIFFSTPYMVRFRLKKKARKRLCSNNSFIITLLQTEQNNRRGSWIVTKPD